MAAGADATAVEAGTPKARLQVGNANVATDNTKASQKGGAACSGHSYYY